jgi:hypothetical protein
VALEDDLAEAALFFVDLGGGAFFELGFFFFGASSSSSDIKSELEEELTAASEPEESAFFLGGIKTCDMKARQIWGVWVIPIGNDQLGGLRPSTGTTAPWRK